MSNKERKTILLNNLETEVQEIKKIQSELIHTPTVRDIEDNSFEGNKIIYQDVIDRELLSDSLQKLKSSAAPGVDGEVKGNFNDAKLDKLAKDLATQKYTPRETRKVSIPKPDGGTRNLGIATIRDKIVQQALKSQLEPKMEEFFSDDSWGFRPGKSAHGALKVVKNKWQNVTWIISVDIAKYFDTIDHDSLMDELKKVCDQATSELFRKLLKVGYLDRKITGRIHEKPSEGTPQGSVISPLLANIFLHNFDVYMDKLMERWNYGEERRYVEGYQTRKLIPAKHRETIRELSEELGIPDFEAQVGRLKHNQWVKEKNPSRDPKDGNFRRLRYVRYADDFLIGFTGTKSEAEEIKSLVQTYLEEVLKLRVNTEKSAIYHSGDRGIKFLGFFVRYIQANKVVNQSGEVITDVNNSEKHHIEGQLKNTAINKAQLRVPINHLLEKAVEAGFAKVRKGGTIRATSNRKLTALSDTEIVVRFSSIIRGLTNYYSPANSLSDMWAVVSIYRKSCALTLADKHKLKTAAKAYKRYGPRLKVSDPIKPMNTVELFYPKSLKTTTTFKLGKADTGIHLLTNHDLVKGSYNSRHPQTHLVCQYEGCLQTTGLEEHHINPVGNISKNLTPLQKKSISNRRKTITLCREHHLELHKGKVVK